MNIKITRSHVIALAITIGIALWMSGGETVIGGKAPEVESPPIAERNSDEKSKAFRVSYVEIQEIERERFISVRGRTKADAIVPIRAETGGILEQRLVERGDLVKSGDLVCVIESGARVANVESAKASLERAKAEYEANEQLAKKGFASDNKMRQLLANLNAAKAQLKQADWELERVNVRANAAGIVQDPIASVGDVLQPGGTCVTLNDSDPMFFTGQVAEREIGAVTNGLAVELSVVTGEALTGEVSYVAPSADPQTRTFNIEVRLNNGETKIRDGLTATAKIVLPPAKSFRISPSWITLADSGEVGVKTVNSENKVGFKPISILAQTNNGFWVSGLENGDRIITLGQEYVIAGEVVDPVADPVVKAELAQ